MRFVETRAVLPPEALRAQEDAEREKQRLSEQQQIAAEGLAYAKERKDRDSRQLLSRAGLHGLFPGLSAGRRLTTKR